jgi:hypothetical protein
MKKLILFAGAAAFALGTPALADPGKGHGKQGIRRRIRNTMASMS